MNELWYVHTMEYLLLRNKKGYTIDIKTWMDFKSNYSECTKPDKKKHNSDSICTKFRKCKSTYRERNQNRGCVRMKK